MSDTCPAESWKLLISSVTVSFWTAYDNWNRKHWFGNFSYFLSDWLKSVIVDRDRRGPELVIDLIFSPCYLPSTEATGTEDQPIWGVVSQICGLETGNLDLIPGNF